MMGNSAMKELIGTVFVKYEIICKNVIFIFVDFLLSPVIPDICIHGDCNFYVLCLNDAVQKKRNKMMIELIFI